MGFPFSNRLVLIIIGTLIQNYFLNAYQTTNSDVSVGPVLNTENCGKRYYQNGFPVDSRLFEHPWLVQLGYKLGSNVTYIFQALLIHKRFMITTVHVAQFDIYGSLTYARLGEYNTATNPDCLDVLSEGSKCAVEMQDILIEVVINHPQFDPSEMFHNIALVKLRSEVKMNELSVAPICLIQDADFESSFLYTVSWSGRRETGLSLFPKQYQMNKITPQKCEQLMPGYKITLSKGMFCVVFGTVHSQPQDNKLQEPTLRGGNGGPIFTVKGDNQIFLVGLLSYSPKYPAKLDQPYIVTPAGPYYEWLEATIQSDVIKQSYLTLA